MNRSTSSLNPGVLWDLYHLQRSGTGDCYGHHVLHRVLLETLSEKAVEYETDAAIRIYCSNPMCALAQGQSRFLDHAVLGEDTKVICPGCNWITCMCCKQPIHAKEGHICATDDYDTRIVDHINSLPENERWLWRQCYRCRHWIVKSEACNHLTCRCSAQFCLVCGRRWEEGQAHCPFGCPHFEEPVYDEEGLNQEAFHRDTGLDRNGFQYDPDHDHGALYPYNDDLPDENNDWGFVYGDDGFNNWGTDREGYDREGFDPMGYNRAGLDRHGHTRDGWIADDNVGGVGFITLDWGDGDGSSDDVFTIDDMQYDGIAEMFAGSELAHGEIVADEDLKEFNVEDADLLELIRCMEEVD